MRFASEYYDSANACIRYTCTSIWGEHWLNFQKPVHVIVNLVPRRHSCVMPAEIEISVFAGRTWASGASRKGGDGIRFPASLSRPCTASSPLRCRCSRPCDIVIGCIHSKYGRATLCSSFSTAECTLATPAKAPQALVPTRPYCALRCVPLSAYLILLTIVPRS
jgi:hypothetical protein